MGVAPYKTFTFDGVSSANYDVYLTGVGVYNAPKRSVEMLSIAGRNGDYALDQGKFENVSVTYRVGMYDTDETNFATKVSNFRNWLCSKVGYVRLEDEYNPNEYRMAVYADGFELDHDMLIAGEAEITFNCKPQRWLTSGETATAVANNGTLSNPTLFESEPLLAVKGYGDISFNNYRVSIDSGLLGDIVLSGTVNTNEITINESNLNVGDTITVELTDWLFGPILPQDTSITYNTKRLSETITDSNSSFSTMFNSQSIIPESTDIIYRTIIQPLQFVAGTNSTVSNTVAGTINCTAQNGSTFTVSFSTTQQVKYTASTHEIALTRVYSSVTTTASHIVDPYFVTKQRGFNSIIGHSTKSSLGDPTYIDCDLGECYLINNGSVVSLNHLIDLGSDLPKLSTGTNTFTYDNTVTELKVTPRWWKV